MRSDREPDGRPAATWIGGRCATNGVDVRYLRSAGAKGPAVLLLHGLTGSGACWTPVARVLEGEFDVVMPDARGRHPERSPEIVELLAAARLETRMGAFDVLTPPTPAYRDVVRAIDVPILLVIGDRSPVVTLETAAELRSLNPRVRVERVQEAGHGLPYDQPVRLGEAVASFARELP